MRKPSVARVGDFDLRSLVNLEVRTILGGGFGSLSKVNATTTITAALAKATCLSPKLCEAANSRSQRGRRDYAINPGHDSISYRPARLPRSLLPFPLQPGPGDPCP